MAGNVGTVRWPAPNRPALDLRALFAAIGRGLVTAQSGLDERARASILAWENDGIPPSAWTVSDCRVALDVEFGCTPKRGLFEKTGLLAAARTRGVARLALNLTYAPVPQDAGGEQET